MATRIRFALLLVLTAAYALSGSVAAQQADPPSEIVGSWIVTVTTNDGTSFTNLATYSSDGIVASHNLPASATDPTAPVDTLYFPAGIGTWEQNADGEIAATIVLLYGDIDGILIAVETVRWDVTVDDTGDAYSGGATFVATLPTGEEVYGGTSVLEGVRITVQNHGTPIQLPGVAPFATPAA